MNKTIWTTPDNILLAHMDDLAARAVKAGAAYSDFLTASEAEEIRRYFSRRNDVVLTFDGGFADAERTIAIFTNAEWGGYKREEVLSALLLRYRKQDHIAHRDVLGAVLALGIERAAVGDIFVGNPSYVVCLQHMAGFIRDNLEQVGRVGLTVDKMPLSALPELTHHLAEKTGTVASLRFDAVTAVMFHLSRGEAAEHIRQGNALLSHRACEEPSKEVSAGDIISVRGLGRAKLLEIGGQSRKGRVWIRFGVY
jgi:RNA-binding protein YlmH